MSDTFPQMIGKYKIIEIIAKGGMGVVYKAFHPSLKRYVVIKKMTARKNSANIERFKREAQILLDLQSPYIVHLFDYFTEGSYRYMVEELVDGMALDKLIQKQTVISPQVALLIMQDACLALKYAHSKDIVHRDIKPGNILISKKAEIKLADFGIASGDKEQDSPSITESGVALGTPAYMPPEQFENSANVDQRADIYALGIMLYEMVTGSKPYPGTLSIETLNTIRKGKYIAPNKIDKTIPPVVCKLIKKMLQPNPKRRFQSTASILNIIKRYLKHYDTHAIRVQLAKMILSPKPLKEEPFVPKDLKIKKVRRIVLSLIFVAAALGTSWYLGLIHKYVLKPWFTPVDIEMQMPATSSVNSDLPVKAFFFENDGNEIPEIKNSRREVIQVIDKNNPNKKVANRTYKIKEVYLRPGNYRIKVVAGPYVWWKSFSVEKEKLTIKCDFLKNMRRALSIRPHAYDAVTGTEITNQSNFYVWYENNWTKLEEIPAEKIISGSVWKIKVSADGYSEENFSLLFDWYQDELFVSANLQPVNNQ